VSVADLSDTIEQVAGEPAKAQGGAGSAESHPLPDLIAADKHLAAKAATAGTNSAGGPRSGWRGLRPGRVIPPGAV